MTTGEIAWPPRRGGGGLKRTYFYRQHTLNFAREVARPGPCCSETLGEARGVKKSAAGYGRWLAYALAPEDAIMRISHPTSVMLGHPLCPALDLSVRYFGLRLIAELSCLYDYSN